MIISSTLFGKHFQQQGRVPRSAWERQEHPAWYSHKVRRFLTLTGIQLGSGLQGPGILTICSSLPGWISLMESLLMEIIFYPSSARLLALSGDMILSHRCAYGCVLLSRVEIKTTLNIPEYTRRLLNKECSRYKSSLSTYIKLPWSKVFSISCKVNFVDLFFFFFLNPLLK